MTKLDNEAVEMNFDQLEMVSGGDKAIPASGSTSLVKTQGEMRGIGAGSRSGL
jgi:hypothetical protein